MFTARQTDPSVNAQGSVSAGVYDSLSSVSRASDRLSSGPWTPRVMYGTLGSDGGSGDEGVYSPWIVASSFKFQDAPKGKLSTAIVTIGNTLVAGGAALVSLPYAVKYVGVAVFVPLLVVLCGASLLGALLLLTVYESLDEEPSLFNLALSTLGRAGGLATQLVVALHNFGVAAFCLAICGELVAHVSADVLHLTSVWLNRTWVIIYLTVALTPLMALASMRGLRFVSLFAVLCASALVALTIALALHRGLPATSLKPEPEHMAVVADDWWNVVRAVPIICFVFTFAMNLLPAYAELARPSFRRIAGASTVACVIAAAHYALFGVFGYALFAQQTQANFLANLSRASEVLPGYTIDGLKLVFGVGTALSIPLFTFECREMLDLMLFPQTEPTTLRRMAETMLIAAAAALVAVIAKDVSLLLRVFGSTTAIAISHLLPGLMYLCMATSQKTLTGPHAVAVAVFVALSGLLCGVCATVSVKDIVDSLRSK